MHREYQPARMAIGHVVAADHDHHPEHDHDPDAERRVLVATTAVVGALLGAHLALGAWEPAWA